MGELVALHKLKYKEKRAYAATSVVHIMIYLGVFNTINVLKHSKCISHYLAWMVIVSETIYDRYRCTFRQVQNILQKTILGVREIMRRCKIYI